MRAFLIHGMRYYWRANGGGGGGGGEGPEIAVAITDEASLNFLPVDTS